MTKRVKTEAWEPLAAEALSGLGTWRAAHPKATLAEIERETDRRLAALRARMIEDLAQVSEMAHLEEETTRPRCPACGCELVKQGQHRRQLTTQHEQTIRLSREYMSCPTCGAGVFPPG